MTEPRSRRVNSGSPPRGFTAEDVRAALISEHGPGKVETGTGYIKAPCVHPDHDDEHPSMSVSDKGGRVLVHCHAGCDQSELWDALVDLMVNSEGVGGEVDGIDPRRECTLSAYAEAKALPIGFLEELGLQDQKLNGRQLLRIPYSDAAVRYRTALIGDNRFRWKSGSRPSLYGLFREEHEDYVVIVEGESCAQTLWHHGIPALGLPGASNWNEERDAEHLAQFERIYVAIEPDKGGEAVMSWIAKSSIRDRALLFSFDRHKDVSDAYVADPTTFPERFQEALGAAKPWREFEEESRKVVNAAAWERCEALAGERDILRLFREDVRRAGVVGEEKIASLLYLAVTSRRFGRPVSVVVKGPSSAGKSYVVEQVLLFFPESAFYSLSAMSDRALVYWEEDLRHRMLVLYEAEALKSDFLSYILRSLLSEGQVRYVTVESTPDGLVPREIVRPGPTGLLLTTTKVAIHPENETRMLSLTISDSTEQTREVLLSIARGADTSIDFEKWRALQEWISTGEDVEVVVPYAEKLAELLPPVATRLRRDFTTLLMLIRAHALLHQETRERDEEGRIVATVDDYSVVRDLSAHVVAEGAGVAASKEVVEVVEAVRDLLDANRPEGRCEDQADGPKMRIVVEEQQGVSSSQIARHLGLDETTAWRRVQVAIKGNFLKNLETRKFVKARIVVGDAPLDDAPLLPHPEDLR